MRIEYTNVMFILYNLVVVQVTVIPLVPARVVCNMCKPDLPTINAPINAPFDISNGLKDYIEVERIQYAMIVCVQEIHLPLNCNV